jgi:hypothetical protein
MAEYRIDDRMWPLDELKGNSIYTILYYWDILGILGCIDIILHYFTLFHIFHYCTLILLQFDTS